MRAPLIVIVGETASGKSALAIEIAEKFDGEIISADSWAVYRGFNIGTAKPTLEEQTQIPHHLIDVAGPEEGFSAAVFKRLAMRAIDDIHGRGKLPILVGGTGLYVDSVLYDYGFLARSEPTQRANLDTMDLSELVRLTQELNLDTTGIDMRNKRRVIRLIENGGQRPTKKPLRADTLVLGMHIARDSLDERIERRVDAMLEAGLEVEVKELADKYGWKAEPMNGIGYREWQDYFASEKTLAETRHRIIRGTLQLAKKQRTWFRRNNSIQWVHNSSEAVELVTTFLNK